MKGLTIGALALVAVASAGCSGCSTIVPAASALKVDQGLYVAEAAFRGANLTAEQAVQSGLVASGSPLAVQAADGLATAKTALDAAEKARGVSDARTEGDQVLAAENAIAGVMMAVQGQKE